MEASETALEVVLWTVFAVGWLGAGIILIAVIREAVQALRRRLARRDVSGSGSRS